MFVGDDDDEVIAFGNMVKQCDVERAPQPWRNGPLYIYFQKLPATESVRTRVYNAAGELVLESWANGAAARVQLADADKLASGIYLIEATWVRGAAVIERKAAKLAVAR